MADKNSLRILLACSAGMSTSLLEKRINDYIATTDKKHVARAMSSNDAKQHIKDYDVILLGPQVRFMLNEFKDITNNMPLGVIPAQVYGLMKGKETVELAEEVYANHQK